MTWAKVEGEVEKPHADLEGRSISVADRLWLAP